MVRLNAPAPDITPADFTFVCPTEILGFHARRPEFAQRDCEILAVSVDDTVQEKVLGLGSADIPQPVKAGAVMFLSFLVGAVVPLAPLVLTEGRAALPLSWAPSIAVLLGVGILKGVLTGRSLLRSGLEFASVALGSAVVGWLVGTLFERALGITVP